MLDRRTVLAGGAALAIAPTGSATAAQPPPFFPGYRTLDVEACGVRFAGVIGGSGPLLLLLHGYPETHIAWRKIAGELARRYTVIAPDLPGYGASRPMASTPRWTKRRVGEALVALMRALRHDRFAIVGHDRGARAGYRLVLDHPGVVIAFASLTVVPTLDAVDGVDYRFAHKNYHWFLFSQPEPLPETLLAAAPDAVIDWEFDVMRATQDAVIEPAARAAYGSAFRNPAVRHAMCEHYRSALDEDLAYDRADRAAGRKLDCPVLALWPNARAAEDRPAEVLAALMPFLRQHAI